MDEKKLLDQIRQSASDLTPPESLTPDAIEKLLTQKKPARKKIFTIYRFAGAAAVFALCAVSFLQVQKIQKYSASLERRMTENIVSQEADAGTGTADKESGISNNGSKTSTANDGPGNGSKTTAANDSSDNESKTSTANDAPDNESKISAADSDSDSSSTEKSTSAKISQKETSAADTSETQEPVSNVSAAEIPENMSLLPTAQSYEEVYSALRKKFYYEDDIVYDMGMDLSVLTSSVAAVDDTLEIEEDVDAPAGSMEDGAPAVSEDFSIEDSAPQYAAGDMGKTADSISVISGTGAASIEVPELEEEYPAEEGMPVENSVSADEDFSYAQSADSPSLSMAQAETARTADNAPAEENEITKEEITDEEDADYSKTNIQEFGVDEADIVKTDGKYIYILRRNGSVTIVDAREPQNLKEVSTIPPADSDLLGTNELYVDGDILNVIATRQSTSLEQNGDVYYPSSIRQTVLYTYDISDRAAPKLSGTAIQDGDYQTSRKNGSFIYLFTSWYPDLGATYQESRIIPTVNGVDLEATDFYLPESLTSSSYLLISSVNTEDPQNIFDKKALVSGTSNFYVSPENIYIANENWNSDTTMTDIMKFHYEDGTITGTAAGSVKGYLNNSFSLNEYNGSLRVVSTYYDSDYEEQNGLYILDDALHITGSIENLAEGETIRSARFFGDIGYFVTFRQTDPLFSVDLSDPASPRVLGELKVSGFSSYLHFYGKDLLLGLGYEADEQTGITSGVKLSMFDVSDPANVTELHRLVIPGVTWCPSIENYKSILIDPQKNIFGFFCGERYLVFSYDKDKGFVSELVHDFVQDALSEQAQTPEGTSTDSHFEDNESSENNSADLDTYETGSVPGSIFVPLDGDTGSDASESSAGKISENSSHAVPEEDTLTETDTVQAVPEEDILTETDAAQAVPEFEITISDSAYYPSISADNTRGLYIGNTFYLAGDVSVIAFDMADGYSKLGKLSL